MKNITIPAGTENCLDYMLNKGIEVERQCRQGHCGACKMIIVSGEVRYQEEPLAWIEGDEFLPCCATTTTELVVKPQ